MQELEKILEEIEKKQVMWPLFDEEDRTTGIINVNVVKGIIRKHLSCENDQETTRSPRDSCGECSRRKWYQIGYEDGKDTDVITKILTEMQEVKEIVLSPKDGDCFGVPCDGDDCLLCVVDKCIEIVQKHANGGWIPVHKDNVPDHEILACDRYGNELIGYLDYDSEVEEFVCESNDVIMYQIIAWMEKPEPYSQERRNMCTANI